MLKCTESYEVEIIDIIRAKSYPKNFNILCLRVPSVHWRRPEKSLSELDGKNNQEGTTNIVIWLEALHELLEVLDVRTIAKCIVVRTNIYQLAEAIKKDLYVKDAMGARVAQMIHERLAEFGKYSGSRHPLELRVVFIPGGTPHPLD